MKLKLKKINACLEQIKSKNINNNIASKEELQKTADISKLSRELPPLFICGKLVYPEEYLKSNYQD